MTNETPTSTLLELLNSMRADRDQLPLKSWKGSRTALEQTVEAYKVRATEAKVVKVAPAVAEGAYTNSNTAEHATELKGKDAKARDAIKQANTTKETVMEKKIAANTKRNAKDAEKVAANERKLSKKSDLVSLADIARELKIEPKLARAKARRSDEITKLAQGDSWTFKPADAAKVKKLLK